MAEETYYASANRGTEVSDDLARLQDWTYLCLAKWYWFVVALVITFALGAVYVLTTPPTYTRQASILIKEDDNGSNLTSEFSQFSDMGIKGSNTNLYNEMISLKSPSYMVDVVRNLHLDMRYKIDGSFHEVELYGKSLPISVVMPDLSDEDNAAVTVQLLSGNKAELSDFIKNENEFENQKPIVVSLGQLVQTPIGKIRITPTGNYTGKSENPIFVTRTNISDVTNSYVGALQVELNDDKASVVDIKIDDQCPDRAVDVLNNLFEVYNKKWVEDINKQAISTSAFIDEELRTIESQLGNVDEDISSFKSKHMVPDLSTAQNIYMNKAEQTSSKILDLDNQLYMAKYIKHQLQNRSNSHKLLPANSGIDNQSVASQISAYNEKLLQRNNLVANSSVNNPLVKDLDQALEATRSAIIASLDNIVATISNQLADLQGSERETKEQISSNPRQAKYLLSVERQQKVKEQLYLFLLQKKEENQLSKAFTAYNTKMLNHPAGKKTPTKPVKLNIILICLALGLFIPMVILFIISNFDTTVHSRKDLDVLTIPFLGEIPLSYHRRTGIFSFLNKRKEVREIVVKDDGGDSINEAFRVMRTNFEFVAGKYEGCKTIMFTSANVGSGKTFTTMNLAVSFAIKKNKVLVIDLDLRKASLSTFVKSPSKGFSDYLNGHIKDLSSVMVKGTINPYLDVLPVGTIPPNPTELLFSEKLEQTVAELKQQYDYIFIDCPPLEIVADASIINKLADMTVYVIRAELFDKRLLPDVEKYYQEKRYKNLNVVLNGTIMEQGGYGYHRYGYGYGYGYGRRYGYGNK